MYDHAKRAVALILTLVCLTSCGKAGKSGHKWQNSDTLNEWQINLLEAQGLPTDIEKLTPMQKLSIQHIYEMITYLNDKYGEEFVYAGYIQPGLMDEETLLAYPKKYGADGGRNTVKVTVDDNGNFIDTYSSLEVRNYYESLINNFTQNYFDSNEVKIVVTDFESEFVEKKYIKNEDFEKKISATNLFFIPTMICSKSNFHDFTDEVAKWMKLHNVYGHVRITMIKNSNTSDISYSNYSNFYDAKYMEEDCYAIMWKNGEFQIAN